MNKQISFSQIDAFLKKNHFPLWVAINHHKTHTNKRMTLDGHHYLKPILMDKSKIRVVKKSTQGGVSECLIILVWSAALNGSVVFYVLPTDGLKNRFVDNRYEKSMMLSPYYRMMRTSGRSEEFKKDLIDNKSLKDVGTGVINFAGSQSDVPFVEIPADWLVVDEADQCDPKRLEMGLERLGHSSDPHEIYVGNPSFVGSFLDNKYNESTKSLWTIKGDCGHFNQIDFFKHIVRQVEENEYIIRDKEFDFHTGLDIRPICDQCGKPFDRFAYGEYVATQKSDISGKQISRIFSGKSPLFQVVQNFSKALENDFKMQRFYNSVLGESYTAEGSKISARIIQNSIGDFTMPSSSVGPCIMGVDVGNEIHVRINKVLPDGKKQAVYIGKVLTLEELFSLRKNYNVVASVIDAMPEIRLSRKFSHSHPGSFRCFFGSEKSDSMNIKEKVLTVSRTNIIDEMKEQIVLGNVLFPKNILHIEEYMDHIQEPTRVWDEDKEVYSWISNRADHFFFAETYCRIAEKVLKFIK